MRWMLYAVAALALLIAAIAIIGLLLPRDHVATRRMRFRKPAETVFPLIIGIKDEKVPVEFSSPLRRAAM